MQQHMSQADLALFRQAEAFAKTGNTLAAYRLFCLVANHGNPDIEIQFWILQTTHWPTEARELLEWLERTNPNHPALPRARSYVRGKWGNTLVMSPPPPTGPVMTCPYCGTKGPTVMKSHTTTVGWIIFVLLLIVVCTIVFCWIGLLIQEKRCTCSRCGTQLTTL